MQHALHGINVADGITASYGQNLSGLEPTAVMNLHFRWRAVWGAGTAQAQRSV